MDNQLPHGADVVLATLKKIGKGSYMHIAIDAKVSSKYVRKAAGALRAQKKIYTTGWTKTSSIYSRMFAIGNKPDVPHPRQEELARIREQKEEERRRVHLLRENPSVPRCDIAASWI